MCYLGGIGTSRVQALTAAAMKKTPLLRIAACLLACIPAARAATVLSTNSVYIRNDTGGGATNQNADTDIEEIVGWNAGTAGMELRGLYQFDVSAIASDVNTLGGGNFANLTINSVTLTLFERRGLTQSFQIDVYSYGFNFNEATATWNNPAGDGSDLTVGGTFGSLLTSGAVAFTATTADNESFTFIDSAAFRNALFNAAQGDGSLELMLDRTGSPAAGQTGFLSFSSDEQGGGTGLRRPTLSFDYSVVPEPSAALLGGLGLIALLRRRR